MGSPGIPLERLVNLDQLDVNLAQLAYPTTQIVPVVEGYRSKK